MNRRDFLKSTLSAVVAASVPGFVLAKPSEPVNALYGFDMASGKDESNVYYWDSQSTELPDNDGKVFQVTGVTTGRWIKQH